MHRRSVVEGISRFRRGPPRPFAPSQSRNMHAQYTAQYSGRKNELISYFNFPPVARIEIRNKKFFLFRILPNFPYGATHVVGPKEASKPRNVAIERHMGRTGEAFKCVQAVSSCLLLSGTIGVLCYALVLTMNWSYNQHLEAYDEMRAAAETFVPIAGGCLPRLSTSFVTEDCYSCYSQCGTPSCFCETNRVYNMSVVSPTPALLSGHAYTSATIAGARQRRGHVHRRRGLPGPNGGVRGVVLVRCRPERSSRQLCVRQPAVHAARGPQAAGRSCGARRRHARPVVWHQRGAARALILRRGALLLPGALCACRHGLPRR